MPAVFLYCENTCDEPLELVDGIPKNKGMGIWSILNAGYIYQGQVRDQVSDGICSVCIAFPLWSFDKINEQVRTLETAVAISLKKLRKRKMSVFLRGVALSCLFF